MFVVCLREALHPKAHKARVREPHGGGQLALDISLSQEVAALARVGEEKHLAPSAPAEFP